MVISLPNLLPTLFKSREPVHEPAKEIIPGDAAWYMPATNSKVMYIARVLRCEFEPSIYPVGEWMIYVCYWIQADDDGRNILVTTWVTESELAAI